MPGQPLLTTRSTAQRFRDRNISGDSPSTARHFWISGPRRSGTTAVWQLFRGLDGVTCYDEPFNPKLRTDLPAQHRKGTWDEFIALWNTDHARFTDALATLDPSEEVSTHVTHRDLDYLRYLARTPTVIDFTRLNFKMGAVLPAFPDAIVLFLYRSPIAFATSHLINSENRKFLRQRYYRTMFFNKRIGFDAWSIEASVETPGFASLVEACAITPRSPLGKLRSVEKLLLYWLTVRRFADMTLAADTRGRTFCAAYEDIIDGTSQGFEDALSAMGLRRSQLNTSHLRAYSRGHRPRFAIWKDLARNAGFSPEDIERYLRPVAE